MSFKLLGLTGGIASGKSAVAAILSERGVPILDADEIARAVVAPDSEALGMIVEAFGTEVLDPSGQLDRRKMAAIVFADSHARKRLESITHPRIRQRTEQRASQLARQGHPLAVYEAALIVENRLADKYRPLIVTLVDPATQIARLMGRDGLSETQARSRIDAQMPLHEKASHADYVIDTQGSLQDVRRQTETILRMVCDQLGVPRHRYGILT